MGKRSSKHATGFKAVPRSQSYATTPTSVPDRNAMRRAVSLSSLSNIQQIDFGIGIYDTLQNPACSGRLPYNIDLCNKFRLNIVKGDIEKQKVDVIVCPTYTVPVLSGAVADTMKKTGGKEFVQCCNQLETLDFGEVKRRNAGGRLKCKHVYLTKLKPSWSYGSWKAMYNIVKESIEAASNYEQKTIAFPMFGTDNLYPADEVAQAMIESIIQFDDRCPFTSLTDVYIVVNNKDRVTTKILETFIPSMFTSATIKDRKVPDNWTVPSFMCKDVEEVELNPNDKMYIDVKAKFIQGKCSHSKIERIVQIENRFLWTQYQARKCFLERQNSHKIQNERELWHGTDKETAKQIVNGGYNRSYAGKNATCYGRGTYFAVKSAMSGSDIYAEPDSNGVRRMILNRVLTGFYTKVDSNATVLPTRITTDKGKIPYDSAVNDENNIKMFIIFHDCQAYPAYLIEYRS